ncbi:MAG: AzlC family ABC transporter permease [Pseudomonadota bacterium]
MPVSTEKSQFWRGTRDGAPFLLAVVPFGMLFGVVATEAGLNLTEIMGMSIVVVAGAAQFTAISLMQDGAPTLIVILTALAVNLRMAMYSAALTPYLGAAPLWQRAAIAYMVVDQSYAVSALTFERETLSIAQRVSYFTGVVWHVILLWYATTYVGAVIGETIPSWLALDFALPIMFLAIVAPALRTLPHVGAATVSIVLALSLTWVPYQLGLLIAALAAMLTGAELERRLGK